MLNLSFVPQLNSDNTMMSGALAYRGDEREYLPPRYFGSQPVKAPNIVRKERAPSQDANCQDLSANDNFQCLRGSLLAGYESLSASGLLYFMYRTQTELSLATVSI